MERFMSRDSFRTCRPSKLTLMHTSWLLCWRKPPKKFGRDLWGLCDQERQRIYIDPRLSRPQQVEVLFHELWHAYLLLLPNLRKEEDQASLFGTSMALLLQSNPQLVEWLAGH